MQAAVTWSWDTLVREIHRVLVPGGTVQFAEFIYDHVTRDEIRRRQFIRSPVKRMESKFTQVPHPTHLCGRLTRGVACYITGIHGIQKVYYYGDTESSTWILDYAQGGHQTNSNWTLG